MPLSQAEIEKRFGKHPAAIEGPNPNEPAHRLLREAYVDFASVLNQLLPDSRDASLAMTSLEEASMWAHKAVGREEYQVVDLGSTDPLTFEQELVKLINKHGLEKFSNTADWILTEFVRQMLEAFDLAIVATDGDDEWAVNDYAAKAVRALDVGVRLRERQSAPTEAVRAILEEDGGPSGDHRVPLVDRTGETPTVVGEATIVEKHDGYHIEAVLPDGFKPDALHFSMLDKEK